MKKSKRLLAIMLATAMTFTNFAMDSLGTGTIVEAATADANGFVIQNGVLTDYVGSASNVVIPNGVTSIGNDAFWDCDTIINVTIPDGVTSIGESAFRYCDNLMSVTIPNGVVSIGEFAFADCPYLSSITIPEGVSMIGNYTFDGCESLREVKLPDSIIMIGEYAFHECKMLSTINLPENLTSIGIYAFGYCSNLNNIVIPNSVNMIGRQAFYECTSLTAIKIPSTITNLQKSTFCGCSKLAQVELPEGLTTIGEYAFYQCSSLKNLTIPSTVTSIGNEGFYESGLTSIVVPDNVTSMGEEVFYNCDQLTEVTLSKNLTSIGTSSFQNCDAITEIKIPEGVASIGEQAFYVCDNLKKVWIPNSVTAIGSRIFQYYDKVVLCGNQNSYVETFAANNGVPFLDEKGFKTKNGVLLAYEGTGAAVVIPERVTSIDAEAFKGCNEVTSIAVSKNVTSIGNGAFAECSNLLEITVDEKNENYQSSNGNLYTKDGATLLACPAGKTEVSLTNTVTGIGDKAFYNCKKIKTMELPPSLILIGAEAFYNNSALEELTIPDGVTSIGKNAFANCSYLSKLYVPNSVSLIGSGAFTDCRVLTVQGEQGSYAQKYIENTTIPYEDDKGFVTVGTTLTDYTGTETQVELPSRITSIGNRAFADCVSLESVTITGNVRTIEDRAFSNCSSLVKVVMPNSVTNIGDNAFENSESAVLYGNEGSYANEYAQERNQLFVSEKGVVIPETVTTLSQELIRNLLKQNKENETVITAEINNDRNLTYTFAKNSMKLVTGKDVYDFGAEIITDYEEFKESMVSGSAVSGATIEAEDFAFKIDFNYDGELPGEATISIPVDSQWIGQTLYYYEVKEDGQWQLITSDVVDYDGTFTVKQKECYDCIALTSELKEKEIMLGDVNQDSSVTLADAQLALRAALLLDNLTPEQIEAADANKDSSLTLADAQKILRVALLLDKFE